MRCAAKRSGAARRRPSPAISSLLSALALFLAAAPLKGGEPPAPTPAPTPAPAAAPRDVDARVDAAVADMAARRNLRASEKTMVGLGAAAVPRLVHHLKGTDRRSRLVALCVLHHCWSDAAREPLAAALKDRDPEVRELAAGALARRLDAADFHKLVGPLVEDESSYVASRILPLLEEKAPDAARMKKCLARPALHEALAKHLPRYESAELTPLTLPLLGSFEKNVRRAAAASLTFQGPFLHEYPVGSEVPFNYAGRQVKGRVFACGETLARLEVEVDGRKVRFGLRRRPLWICGYIDPAKFKAGGHGWVDPQKFIRGRLKPPAKR
mgnify:CR=1 FL=1